MLGWAMTFLSIALTAGAFSMMASPSDEAARMIFFVFMALFGMTSILRGLFGPSVGEQTAHR